MILGVSLCMREGFSFGFSGYLGDLRLITGCFMDFWVGLMSVGPPQGDSWVFGYLWGFFMGLRAGLCI